MELLKRITHDPAVMGGRPCIRGMGVTVEPVVGLLDSGHSVDEVLRSYPHLEKDDVEAAKSYGGFLNHHIPHRLCLSTTFRDRQPWFKERIGRPDGDLLRVAKDSALISIRMFAKFLRLKSVSERPDDVFVDSLGGTRARLEDLTDKERSVIDGLHARANKELAHLTCDYTGHDDFNTARAMVDGIDIIERLLREHLYDPLNWRFPDLAKEKLIGDDEYQLVDGKKAVRRW